MSFLLVLLLVLLVAYILAFYLLKAPDHSRFEEPGPSEIIPVDLNSESRKTTLRKLEKYHREFSSNVPVQRQRFEEFYFKDVPVELRKVFVEGMECQWVLGEDFNPQNRILYLHGGSFTYGSYKSHRVITAELAKRTGFAVLAVNYGRSPEHKWVESHGDAQKVYKWILENGPGEGDALECLLIAGDSAGASMTLSLLPWSQNEDLRIPDGAIAMAPIADVALSGRSSRANIDTDPVLGPIGKPFRNIPLTLIRILTLFSAGTSLNNPLVSPLFGNLSNLPPTLIQISADEILYSDSLRYANKATSNGSKVILNVWDHSFHVFQLFPDLDEFTEAFDRIENFVEEICSECSDTHN